MLINIKHILVLLLMSIDYLSTQNPAKIQPVTDECDSITLLAIQDFTVGDAAGYVPYYIHTSRDALAVDASKYKGDFALAEHTFKGVPETYNVRITTLSEDDGESYYRLMLNDKLIGEVQNTPDSKNFAEQNHSFNQIELKNGDIIGVAFNAHTNGKIPEGETTAYSRGRWTHLTLVPLCD